MGFCFSLVNVKKDNAIIRQCGARRKDMEELEWKKRKILEKGEGWKGETQLKKTEGKEGKSGAESINRCSFAEG